MNQHWNYANKKTLAVMALLGGLYNSPIQAQKFEWAKHFAGTNPGDVSTTDELAVDAVGNAYTTGQFIGLLDFDPGAAVWHEHTYYANTTNIFFNKLDASGNFVWVARSSQTSSGAAHASTGIAVDASGNVYGTGTFTGNISLGSTLLSNSSNAGTFITKLNSSGTFQWAKQIVGTTVGAVTTQTHCIAVDANGNSYVGGVLQGTANFNLDSGPFNLTSSGGSDAFIAKYDASGNFVWAKRIGGTGSDQLFSIALDASGNIYTTGIFEGNTDFDPNAGTFNLMAAAGGDAFVAKYDASGNFVWAKQFAGNNTDEGAAIALDDLGNIYTTGRFQGTCDFDPGVDVFNMVSTGFINVFVSKLDASGNFVWAKQMGGAFADYGKTIAVDGNGTVHVGGYFAGTADFDPNAGTFNLATGASTYEDAFLCALDASGNFAWAKKWGTSASPTSDACWGIAFDPADNLYCVGRFQGTVDFDLGAGVFNLMGGNSVVLKMSPCPVSYATMNVTSCGLYTAPSGAQYGAGTHYDLISNAAGCDSVIILNVTVVSPSFGYENVTACDSYTWPTSGDTYTMPGFYYDTLVNSVGCDSFVQLFLVLNSSVMGAIDILGACDSYTWHGTTYTTSGTYTTTFQNSVGCDSTVTLHLSIYTDSDSVTNMGSMLVAYQAEAVYQWLDCDNNYAVIPGAIDQSFQPSQTGNYAVEITGCSTDTSDCYLVVISGNNSLALETSIRLSPNPAKDYCLLDGLQPSARLQLFDLTGKLLEEQDAIDTQVEWNTSHLQNGVYLIRIEQAGQVYTQKLVICK